MPNIQHKKSCLLLVVGYKGLLFLENVIDKINIAGVCSYQDNKSSDGCFEKIIHKCKESSLPFREIRRVSSEDIKFYDLVFVVGWQFLLPLDEKIIVFHDSLLPRYRGFAPTVSALINGEKEIGVTAFSPDSGVDTGPIYDQMAVEIVYPITIKDALALQSRLTVDLALRIYEKLEKGLLKAKKQDERSATYSIWRDELDFFINWKESSQRVLRTIDALGYPYPGAKAKIGDEVISITKASAVLPEKKFEIVNPGKVWSISDSGIEVLTGTGSILLKEIADSSNKPFSLKKIRTRFES